MNIVLYRRRVSGGLIGAAIDSGRGAAFSHPVNPLAIGLVPDQVSEL